MRWVEKYLNGDVRDLPTGFPDLHVGRISNRRRNNDESRYFLVDRSAEAPASDAAAVHEFLRRTALVHREESLLRDLLNLAAEKLLRRSLAKLQRDSSSSSSSENLMERAAAKAAEGGTGALLRQEISVRDIRQLLAAQIVRRRGKRKQTTTKVVE